jgi:hypothetical protein
LKIVWGNVGTGRVEGTDFRVERYKVGDAYYYMLANSRQTYLSSKGPFSTMQERDEAIIKEAEQRELTGNR